MAAMPLIRAGIASSAATGSRTSSPGQLATLIQGYVGPRPRGRSHPTSPTPA